MGRKWLTTFGVVSIYVLLSGFILAFAQGYTFDLQTQQLITTGVIEVASFPLRAQVSVDGELLKEKTPVSLSHYTPGNYNFQLDLAGYQQVNVLGNVESQTVTRLLELPLWPELENWDTHTMPGSILAVKSLAESGLFMVQTEKEISWWRPGSALLEKVLGLPVTTKEFAICSDRGEACLITGDARSVLVDMRDRDYKILKNTVLPKDDMSLFRFQSNYFVLSKQGSTVILEKISTQNEVTTEMKLEKVDAFDLHGQDIWYIEKDNVYRKSLISGFQQLVTVVDGSNTIDAIVVTSDYILTHALSGKVILWEKNNDSMKPINTWSNARFFVHNEQVLIAHAAKVWVVTKEKGLQFVGQVADDIIFAQPYTSYSWLANMENGDVEMIMLSPLGMYTIHTDINQVAVLPYQALLKWEGSVFQYHIYPTHSWLNSFSS